MGRNAGNNENSVYTTTIDISQATAVPTGVYNSTANPFGSDVLILGVTVRVTTASTGASTVDIGVGATANLVDDELIDGLSLAATGLFTNAENAGPDGKQTMVWGSAQLLNVAQVSGNVAGVVGQLIVQYTYL